MMPMLPAVAAAAEAASARTKKDSNDEPMEESGAALAPVLKPLLADVRCIPIIVVPTRDNENSSSNEQKELTWLHDEDLVG